MKKKISILGAGESGVGAALLANTKGYNVFVSSSRSIEKKYKEELKAHSIPYEEGIHTTNTILERDCIVKSPGISWDIDVIRKAKERGMEIIDEVEFAFSHCRGKIVAVTGTNGKTTTSSLIYHIMKSGGIRVTFAGNIGVSLSRRVIDDDQYDWYVVELSSFQLEGIKKFKPDIAILLNITPDHLERYDNSFKKYIDTKFQLIRQSTADNFFVYYLDDLVINAEVKKRTIHPIELSVSLKKDVGADIYSDGLSVYISHHDYSSTISLEKSSLQGAHNLVNIMVSIWPAHIAGLSSETIEEGLNTFVPLPHRLEFITEIQHVGFINDSKATNIEATLCALRSIEKPIIWIAGGIDKGNDYTLVCKQLEKKIKLLICFGTENQKLINHFKNLVPAIQETCDMKQLVKMVLNSSEKGDIALFSPACASFDLFKNYEERGNFFRQEVLKLKKEIEVTA